MQLETIAAMRSALALGPDHCPPDLFAGPVDAIVRGLKAHANHISHARHVALEETYPRSRASIGNEAFHRAAEIHLVDQVVLRRPPACIGIGFADHLSGAARDLAAVEWAWLEAHGAIDAPAFDLAAIAGLSAECAAASIVSLHPAARRAELGYASVFAWEGSAMPAAAILVTRPRFNVIVTGIDRSTLLLLDQLDRPQTLGELLERDAAATTMLVTAGALKAHAEILL